MAPKLLWDFGTAYDLFTGLFVLNNPGDFGLRPSWAAGVRSRIPPEARGLFASFVAHVGAPLRWIYDLEFAGEPKDAEPVLERLEALSDVEVLPTLTAPDLADSQQQILYEILHSGRWSEEDMAQIKRLSRELKEQGYVGSEKDLDTWLGWWANAAEFGRLFKAGLRDYYEGFFREEERRIRAPLIRGYNRARHLAEKMSVVDLLEEVTGGLRLFDVTDQEGLILVPSFWISPLILYAKLHDQDSAIICFGARPADAALVPGEAVPDSISRALSAINDHTRLRILRLLAQRPQTQAELSKELRLRAPTITHHLKSLRMAGLVRANYEHKMDRRYEVRTSALRELWERVESFIGVEPFSD